jgi:hypothetical protein
MKITFKIKTDVELDHDALEDLFRALTDQVQNVAAGTDVDWMVESNEPLLRVQPATIWW